MSNQVYRGNFKKSEISLESRIHKAIGQSHLSIWLTTAFDFSQDRVVADYEMVSTSSNSTPKMVPVVLRHDKNLSQKKASAQHNLYMLKGYTMDMPSQSL